MHRQSIFRPFPALCLPAVKPQHDTPKHKGKNKHRDWPMRQPTPQREMLLPTKQGRHGVNVRNVRRDNQRRHRKAGFPFQTHLADERADEAVCEVIHQL